MSQAHGLAGQEMEARHEVGIRLKKLRYGVDFLRDAFPSKKTKRFVKALRELQDQFGRLNDVAQAMHLTNALTGSANRTEVGQRVIFAAGLVRGWYARAILDAEPQLLSDWKAFAATPPFWKAARKKRKRRDAD